jgi:hypothetical protein
VYRALFKAHLDGALIDPIRKVTNGNYGEIVACPLLRPLKALVSRAIRRWEANHGNVARVAEYF